VVSVALPAIQRDLGTSVAAAQWVVNGYLLPLSALILVGGAAGDRFGRRRVFAIGVLLFTAASVACAAAPGAAPLILARAAQGIGGALLVPSSLAIISAAFPPEARGRAIGTWAGFSALTAALGPLLGGWLVDVGSWRLIFLVNLPVAAVTLWLLRGVPESRGDTGAVDWTGGALAALGLGGLVYGLTAAADPDWTQARVLGPVAAGLALLGLFVRHEARTAAPMLPLELFRARAFSGANLMTLLLYAALSGALFFLPFNLIRVQGYSATQAGAAFLPFTLIMAALSRRAGGLVARYGARGPLVAGPCVAGLGLALLAVPGIGGGFLATFLPGMVVLGLGMTISVAPLTTTVMGAVPDRYAGAASGINNAVARMAGMLAVAVLGALAVRVFGDALAERLAAISLPPGAADRLLAQASRLTEARPPAGLAAAGRAAERAIAESFVAAFRATMLVAAGLSLASAACAALTIHAAPPSVRRGAG